MLPKIGGFVRLVCLVLLFWFFVCLYVVVFLVLSLELLWYQLSQLCKIL